MMGKFPTYLMLQNQIFRSIASEHEGNFGVYRVENENLRIRKVFFERPLR